MPSEVSYSALLAESKPIEPFVNQSEEEVRFIPQQIMDNSARELPDVKTPLLQAQNGISTNHCQADVQLKRHCHSSVESKTSNDVSTAKRQLGIACGLVVLFITGEIIGGILSGSLAIMSDAAHMFSDLASFSISLMAIHLSEKPAKKKYTFGYKRAEILGALLSIVIIWYVTGVLLYLAIHRLNTNEFEVESNTMMVVAGAAVGFNILLGVLLHGVCNVPHSHSHGGSGGHSHLSDELSETDSDYDDEACEHNHSHTKHKSQRNINIRAALIHVLGDFLQSLGVLISSIVIKFEPNSKWIDPACTILFSVIVFFTTIRILQDTVGILMEGSPKNHQYDDIRDDLSKVNYVVHVHDLHLWSLSVDQSVLSVHLAVDGSHIDKSGKILSEATQVLKTKHQIASITIQLEEYDDIETKSCENCMAILK